MIKRILLLLILFSFAKSYAQDYDLVPVKKPKKVYLEYNIGKYRFRERNNYLTLGFGLNFYPKLTNPKSNGNISIDYHFFDKKDRIWSVGYQGNSQSYFLKSGNFTYLHSLKVSRALYTTEKQYYKIAAYIGPSIDYTRYYPNDTLKSLNADRSLGIGIQSQVEFIFKPTYDIGLAIIPFINVNTIQTVVGITFSFYGSNAMVKQKD